MSKDIHRIFYRDNEELQNILENLQFRQCPHCKKQGTIIRNGSASGYVDSSPTPVVRRYRTVCNKRRKHNPGCGRGISLFRDEIIPYLHCLATGLWAFALALLDGEAPQKAWNKQGVELSRRASGQRKRRVCDALSSWRGKLPFCREISHPRQSQHTSLLQETLSHFKAIFKQNPFRNFQLELQTSLI